MSDKIESVREVIATCVLILETESVFELEDIGSSIAHDQFMAQLPAAMTNIMRMVYGAQMEHLKSLGRDAQDAATVVS